MNDNIDSDLGRREILAVFHNGPDELTDDWNQSAYDATVERWARSREDDLERLENADDFEWHNAYWELASTGPNEPNYLPKEVNLISGVPGAVRDENPELEETAYEFVAEWFDTFQTIVRKRQANSLLTEREFVAAMLFATLDEQYVAKAMTELTGTNQSVGTVRSYKGRAKDKLREATVTKRLEHDNFEVGA
ncbi:hypothetical protein [Halopiger xanaduensis]|uniref:Uncharacterized protein n=1 Tax=Halopiger xanaduensis (strain DSM 18323 / JCM 14033 / SH-6) TaxID=797210 RepID=F8DEN4_HALXS|nr:hypothetical protein [Halopiger xanaduensis]AEH39471.1 hypothetical protein Halxa_0231 [Halopiger xanaduensis SH-6]